MSSPKEQRDLIQSMAFNGIPVEYNKLIEAGTIIVVGIRDREVRKIVGRSREDVDKFKSGQPGIERVVWVPPDLVTHVQTVIKPLDRERPWDIDRFPGPLPYRERPFVSFNANEGGAATRCPKQPRCSAGPDRNGLHLVA